MQLKSTAKKFYVDYGIHYFSIVLPKICPVLCSNAASRNGTVHLLCRGGGGFRGGLFYIRLEVGKFIPRRPKRETSEDSEPDGGLLATFM